MLEKKSRQTKTKGAVIHYLQSTASPLSLDEMYRAGLIDLPQTAYSTIYRIVQQLEASGLVIRVDWRERGSRYEWAGLPHHHHIVCESCTGVTDVTDTLLHYDDAEITKKTGFIVKHHSVELFGLCKPCQKKGYL